MKDKETIIGFILSQEHQRTPYTIERTAMNYKKHNIKRTDSIERKDQPIRTKQIAFDTEEEAYKWREQYVLNVENAKEPIRGFFSNGKYVFEFEVEV